MPDPTDDNPLFSQDDIDKLLNAQSIEEAEASNFSNEDDLIGELSQDDIDRMLNAASSAEEPETESSDNLDKDGPGQKGKEEIDQEEDDDDLDLGELSQDDIDRMLNAQTSDESDAISDSIDADDDDDGAFDLVSQDDIDKLMGTDLTDDPGSDLDSMSDMDIDDLDVNIPLPADDDIEPEPADIDSSETVIDESEAWNIQDCLITQDTIDNLLSSRDEDVDISSQSADILDDDLLNAGPEAETSDPFQVNLAVDDPEPEFELNGTDDLINSDLDNLLSDSPEDIDDLLNDISQDDIDGFLSESDGEPEEKITKSPQTGDDDSIRNVISQDDIDALLAGTDEEDEDILADMEMDEDLKSIASPAKTVESSLPEDDDAQVILEESDDSSATLADGTVRQLADLMGEDQEKPVKRRFLLKLIIFMLLFVILIAGCVAGAYFLFFKEKVDQLVPSSQPIVKTQESEDLNTSVPDMNIQESQELSPGTITMVDFLVLTPDRKDGITYVSVDITIDYSYSKVFDAINSKLPYYRGIIYDAIENALKSDKGNKLTESELLEIVKDALNQELSEIKVDKIAFANFKTG
ncbi:MAG: hypothetical protein HQK61_04415 [Desulfamplus sp.]|nr:hypothetical protein [Desulfamplus sp.]